MGVLERLKPELWAIPLVAIIAIAGGVALYMNNGRSGNSNSTPLTSSRCVITGQPGPFYLGVLSDSTHQPLVGAKVVATDRPAYCNNQPATSQTSISFTTNGTVWMELPSENNGGYSISVTFSGQTRNFTADLRPVSITCASISFPSGRTNVTITTFGESCSSSGALLSISDVAVASVALGGYPSDIAVNANTSRIYVSDLFANKLTVVDASAYTVIATITLPGTPQSGIAVDPKTDMVYVPVYGCVNEANVSNSCDSSSGSTRRGGIIQIDGRTNAVVGEFPIDVGRLTIDPNTGVLYGASSANVGPNANGSGYLLAIDDRTGSILANTSLGAIPLSLAVDAGTNMVYIGACKAIPLPCEGAEVLAINGTSHVVRSVTPLEFDALNFNVVVDQATGTVYTMGLGSNMTFVAIDGASGGIRYSSALAGSCAGAGGGNLAVDMASDQAFASFYGQQFLLFVDGSTGRIVNMVNASAGVYDVAFNPGTNQVYVTTGGSLMILPGALSQNYVDSSLLSQRICLP